MCPNRSRCSRRHVVILLPPIIIITTSFHNNVLLYSQERIIFVWSNNDFLCIDYFQLKYYVAANNPDHVSMIVATSLISISINTVLPEQIMVTSLKWHIWRTGGTAVQYTTTTGNRCSSWGSSPPPWWSSSIWNISNRNCQRKLHLFGHELYLGSHYYHKIYYQNCSLIWNWDWVP